MTAAAPSRPVAARRSRRRWPRRLRVVYAALLAAAAAVPALVAATPAPASTGSGTWVLDNGPASLGLGELDTVSCPEAGWCMGLEASPYAPDSVLDSDGAWTNVPLALPGGRLQLTGISCTSPSFCMAVGTDLVPATHGLNGVGVTEPGAVLPELPTREHRARSRRAAPGGRQPIALAGTVPRRPARKSSKAWRSSASVFMTKGP